MYRKHKREYIYNEGEFGIFCTLYINLGQKLRQSQYVQSDDILDQPGPLFSSFFSSFLPSFLLSSLFCVPLTVAGAELGWEDADPGVAGLEAWKMEEN